MNKNDNDIESFGDFATSVLITQRIYTLDSENDPMVEKVNKEESNTYIALRELKERKIEPNMIYQFLSKRISRNDYKLGYNIENMKNLDDGIEDHIFKDDSRSKNSNNKKDELSFKSNHNEEVAEFLSSLDKIQDEGESDIKNK